MEIQPEIKSEVLQIKHGKEVHSFYLFILIIAFSIIVLQPLAMLAAVLLQAIAQA